MTPDAENERGTAVAVAVAISHYHQCHIANVPLLLHQGNDDRRLLEPANRCDATIENCEFLENDPSLEITCLKCCSLTQN